MASQAPLDAADAHPASTTVNDALANDNKLCKNSVARDELFGEPRPFGQDAYGALDTPAAREFFRAWTGQQPSAETEERLGVMDALAHAARTQAASIAGVLELVAPFEFVWGGALAVFAALFGWLLGALGFGLSSLALLVWALGTAYLREMKQIRSRAARDAGRVAARTAASIGIGSEIGGESAEWINILLERIWAAGSEEMAAIVKSNLEGSLGSSGIGVGRVSLGADAPRISNVRFWGRSDSAVLEMQIDIGGEPRFPEERSAQIDVCDPFLIELFIQITNSLHMPIHVADLSLSARLRVRLAFDTRSISPSSIDIALADQPLIDFAIRPMRGFDINNMPGITALIESTVSSQISSMLIAPNCITINLADPSVSDPHHPLGVLRVIIFEARSLKNVDFTGASDPCAIIRIKDVEVARTRVIDNSLNPIWNQYLYIPITNAVFSSLQKRSDELHIDVMHINKFQKIPIGSTPPLRLSRWTRLLDPVDLDDLPSDLPSTLKQDPKRPMSRTEHDKLIKNWGSPLADISDVWKPLANSSRSEKRSTGQIRIDLAYFPAIDIASIPSLVASAPTQTITQSKPKFSQGVLTINVWQASDLPSKISPVCSIYVNNAFIDKAEHKLHSKNPAWNFTCSAYCENIETARLKFVVKDKASGVGEVSILARDLISPAVIAACIPTYASSSSSTVGSGSTITNLSDSNSSSPSSQSQPSPTLSQSPPPTATSTQSIKDEWLRLPNTPSGRIRVTVKFTPIDMLHLSTDRTRIQRTDEPCAIIHTTLIKAEGLANVEVLRKSDPYATIAIANSLFGATYAHPNTLNPEWIESFYGIMYTHKDPILINVFDWNDIRADKNIGKIELTMNMLMPQLMTSSPTSSMMGNDVVGVRSVENTPKSRVAAVIRDQVNTMVSRLSLDVDDEDEDGVSTDAAAIAEAITQEVGKSGTNSFSNNAKSVNNASSMSIGVSKINTDHNGTQKPSVSTTDSTKVGMSAAEMRITKRLAELRAYGLMITKKSDTIVTVRAPLFISKSFHGSNGGMDGTGHHKSGDEGAWGSETDLLNDAADGGHHDAVQMNDQDAQDNDTDRNKNGDEETDDLGEIVGPGGPNSNSGNNHGRFGSRSISNMRKMSRDARARAREFLGGRRSNAGLKPSTSNSSLSGAAVTSDANGSGVNTVSNEKPNALTSFNGKHMKQHGFITFEIEYHQVVKNMVMKAMNDVHVKQTQAVNAVAASDVKPNANGSPTNQDKIQKNDVVSDIPSKLVSVQDLVNTGATVESIAKHVTSMYRSGVLRIRINKAKLTFTSMSPTTTQSTPIQMGIRTYIQIYYQGVLVFHTRTSLEDTDSPSWYESGDRFLMDVCTDKLSIVLRQQASDDVVSDKSNADEDGGDGEKSGAGGLGGNAKGDKQMWGDPVLAVWRGDVIKELLGRVWDGVPMHQKDPVALASSSPTGSSIVGGMKKPTVNRGKQGSAMGSSLTVSQQSKEPPSPSPSQTSQASAVCCNAKLFAEFSFMPVQIEMDDASRYLTGLLTLHIKKAHDLLPADRNGLSDPYINVIMNGHRIHRTKVHRRTLNPVFEEKLEGLRIPNRARCKIDLELMDWDPVGSHDALGRVTIHVSELPVGRPVSQRMVIEGGGKGILELDLLFDARSIKVDPETGMPEIEVISSAAAGIPGGTGGYGVVVYEGGNENDAEPGVLAFEKYDAMGKWNLCGTGVGVKPGGGMIAGSGITGGSVIGLGSMIGIGGTSAGGFSKFYHGLTSSIATTVAGAAHGHSSGFVMSGSHQSGVGSGFFRKKGTDVANNKDDADQPVSVARESAASGQQNAPRYGLEDRSRRRPQPNKSTQEQERVSDDTGFENNASNKSNVPVIVTRSATPTPASDTFDDAKVVASVSDANNDNAEIASKAESSALSPLSASVLPTSTMSFGKHGNSGGILLEIVEARGLRAADSNGTSDPYVKVVLYPSHQNPMLAAGSFENVSNAGNHSGASEAVVTRPTTILKTPVVKKTLSPQWKTHNTVFVRSATTTLSSTLPNMPLSNERSAEMAVVEAIMSGLPRIQLVVRDHNMFKSHVDLGHANIDLGGLVSTSLKKNLTEKLVGDDGNVLSNRHVFDEWYSLEDGTGEIRIRGTLSMDSDGHGKSNKDITHSRSGSFVTDHDGGKGDEDDISIHSSRRMESVPRVSTTSSRGRFSSAGANDHGPKASASNDHHKRRMFSAGAMSIKKSLEKIGHAVSGGAHGRRHRNGSDIHAGGHASASSSIDDMAEGENGPLSVGAASQH